MKKIEVNTTCLVLANGIVELTQAQYEPRQTSLKPQGGGVYQIIKPLQFKRGEILGYDGPKLNASLVEEVGKSKKEKAAPQGDQLPPVVVDIIELYTLADIADAMEKSQKEVKELLKEHCDFDGAKKGVDNVPVEHVNKLVELGLLEVVEDETDETDETDDNDA